MKVIFLDFDGVINNWNYFNGVCFENVKYLLQIIEKTDAKIVATSSNKYIFQKDNSVNIKDTVYYNYVKNLNNYGINIMDVTPYVYGNRELEILKYLKLHSEIEQFLILDDDYIINSLLEHQVFLDLYKGITSEHVEPFVRILNGNLGFYPDDFNINETLKKRLIRINNYYNSVCKNEC